ncbi:hypothetical protein ILYODFUR_001166 [Ilyodon furcidens]|uniref:Uncharacterized protein n=1 Tax=Ilyodon furcidens TaxID=33524 RepID=A0ABV0VA38_9TELE
MQSFFHSCSELHSHRVKVSPQRPKRRCKCVCGHVFVCVKQLLHGSNDPGLTEQDSIPDNLRPLSPLRNQINGPDGHPTDRHTIARDASGWRQDVQLRRPRWQLRLHTHTHVHTHHRESGESKQGNTKLYRIICC